MLCINYYNRYHGDAVKGVLASWNNFYKTKSVMLEHWAITVTIVTLLRDLLPNGLHYCKGHKTTASYIWITIIMTHSCFFVSCIFLTVVIVTNGNSLVS